MDQMKVLRESGCCSETSLPTNYDPPGPAVPSTANYNEAKMYRIASSSKPKKPSSVDELKKLLFLYGPLFACGDTPGSATHEHCFAIIGYDDATQSFTIVNSFPVAKGETAKFTGRLDLHLEFSGNNQQDFPQANREIELRRTKRDPIEGTVVYDTIGTARTDGSGQFSLSYAPDATSDYQAFANKPDRTVDASSNVVTVGVGTGSAPAIKHISPRLQRPLP